MCGIFGSLGPITPSDQDQQNLIQELSSRGPDFSSSYIIPNECFLASTRLAMVDFESGANQPFQMDSCLLLFNGEIYNWQDLGNRLELKFNGRKPLNDGEVILSGFLKFGKTFFSKLRGQFALALVDRRNPLDLRLYLARDRFGEKPLFYCIEESEAVFFSSNAKQVLRKTRNLDLLSQEIMVNYLRQGFLNQANMESPSFNQVPIGSIVDISVVNKTKHIQQIPLDPIPVLTGVNAPADKVYYALKEAVRETISSSQFPLGIFLSSGVDSTLIAAISKDLGFDIPAFTISYDSEGVGEAVKASENAEKIGLKHEILNCQFDSDHLETAIMSLDIPLADLSFYPLYALSRFAKTFVKGALTGDGGDELFGGYDTYAATKLNNSLGQVFACLNAGNFLTKYNRYSRERSASNDLIRFMKYASPDSIVAHSSWRNVFDDNEIQNLLSKSCVDNSGRPKSKKMTLREAMNFDQSNWLSQNVLVKSDRASMNNGFELRAPLLSPMVFQASLELNDRQLRFLLKDKVILRDLLRQKYGISVGRKQGFISPISHWIKSNPDYFLSHILNCKRFSMAFVKELVAAHVNLKVNNSHKIYTLFVYSIWSHNFEKGIHVNRSNS